MTHRATQTLLSLRLQVSHQLLKVSPKTRGFSHEHTYPPPRALAGLGGSWRADTTPNSLCTQTPLGAWHGPGFGLGAGGGAPKQCRRALSPQDSRVCGEPSPGSALLPSPPYWLSLSPQQCQARVPSALSSSTLAATSLTAFTLHTALGRLHHGDPQIPRPRLARLRSCITGMPTSTATPTGAHFRQLDGHFCLLDIGSHSQLGLTTRIFKAKSVMGPWPTWRALRLPWVPSGEWVLPRLHFFFSPVAPLLLHGFLQKA